MIFEFPAFVREPRGNSLESFVWSSSGNGSPSQHLFLCGPVEVIEQINKIWPAASQPAVLPKESKAMFSHCLHFPAGQPAGINDFLELSQRVLSIPSPPGVDCVIALDWYTVPDSSKDSSEWVKTDMGRRINYTKHAMYPNGSSSRQARKELHEALASFVLAHPLFAAAPTIICPPGSAADGNSYAENLAKAIAVKTGKQYLPSYAAGPRPQQKEGTHQDLTRSFTVAEEIKGDVIILDDVFRTGTTIAGQAAAAHRAGAGLVLGLTAARTLRN